MQKEFRCTRSVPYNSPDCLGYNNPKARQGHYVIAENKDSALRQMREAFPKDPPNSFTIEFWKEIPELA